MAKEKIGYPITFSASYSEQNIVDVKRIIDWLNETKSRTQAHLVKQIKYSAGSVNTLIKGVHPVDPSPVIDVIIPIIEDTVEVTVPGQFVETSTATIVRMACEKAKQSQRFTVIAGSPGVGKTTALQHHVELNPNDIYICGSEYTTSSVILDELIKALNIKLATSNTKASKANLIINKLAGSKRLLILDEADKCAKDAVDPLRTISERTGCGVVLAGNHQLRENIIVGNNRYDLISDRVVFWPTAINAITLEDCSRLMRPYFTDDMLSDDYDVFVKYAYDITKGSARKLVTSLIPNLIDIYKGRITQVPDTTIDCVWIRTIAKQWMGIINPPPVPQKTAAVAIPA